MDKIAGPEELIANIRSMPVVNEEKLLRYLALYDNQFLYQKAGFLLWDCRDTLGLSDQFFAVCAARIGNSKRYLTRDEKACTYNAEWKLMIPTNIMGMKNGGDLTDASI